MALLAFASKIVFAVEFLHSASGINDLLLACVKGMADVADIYLHITLCALSLKGVATSTTDGGFFIFGVYSLFHLSYSLNKLVLNLMPCF